ncbi:hypothetical protein C8F04DRAFT_1272030 [Mycena alexandri]|uniref:Uncharacterized protein n=1 Tax=Mycena alexandri TaxID=1745969 RepID=A0AAD6S892_9AGAR|nr:hypothetical protein C8F04DRAFT_1272030 [Mycena alexandri]
MFDDLIDSPLDSSALKAASPRPVATPGSPAASETDTPSPSATAIAPQFRLHKRPAEDMSQFAEEVSRDHKLPKLEHDKLLKFAKLKPAEQIISLTGHILAIAQHQKLIQPADGTFKVGARLMDKIKAKSAIFIADSTILAYLDDKIGDGMFFDQVLSHPDWGFKLKDEKYAMDILNTTISLACIAVLSSLGTVPTVGTLRSGALNVVDLTRAILFKLKFDANLVDVRMCGRVAILVCLRDSDHHGSPAGTGALTRARTRQNPYPCSRVRVGSWACG